MDKHLIINDIKNYLNIKTDSEFAAYLGVTQPTISAWKKRNNIDYDLIITKCNEINGDWLLTGQGEMLKSEEKKELFYSNPKVELPNTGYYFPDVSASAGLENILNNNELERIPVMIPGWERGTIFINVYGDSMYPKYNAGEVIGVKPVELDYIQYGYPYVVVLNNGDVFVKYVKKGKDDEHLLLAIHNEFYEPKQFHIKLFKSFYAVKGVIKKETM